MKTILLPVISMLLVFTAYAQELEVKDYVNILMIELESKCTEKPPLHVAILDFRTADDRITPFNNYLQEAWQLHYKQSEYFKLIEQNNVNRVVSNSNWNLEQSNDFTTYANLQEDIFRTLGIGSDAFIYGQINDNIETITITAYLIPQGIKPSRIHASVTFPSNEETDRLLGKRVVRRTKHPKPKDTVVVVRDRVIEREVRVIDTVIVEREIIVEKPISTTNKPEISSEKVVTMHGYRFELINIQRLHDNSLMCNIIITRLQDDMELNLYRRWDRDKTSRFFDEYGAEYIPASINIANKPSDRGYNAHRFVQDVSTPVTMQVTEVAKNATTIKLLEFVAGDSNQDQFKVQFRNVPIDKE